MKVGDILYVINPYKVKYSELINSLFETSKFGNIIDLEGNYHFIPGHMYKIINEHKRYINKLHLPIEIYGFSIKNITTNDDITHFIYNNKDAIINDKTNPTYHDETKGRISCFVTHNEWRKLQFEKIGI